VYHPFLFLIFMFFSTPLLSENLRPSKCPLRSEDPMHVLGKLKLIMEGLGNGGCENRHKNLFTRFDTLVSAINKTNASELLASEDLDLKAQAYLSELTEASKDQDCLNSLKEKGLLGSLAEGAFNMGKIAISIPRVEGWAVGSSSIVFGSIVHIINELLSSPFNWSLEGDRSQFITLNCLFYDVRVELNENHFFKEKTQEDLQTGSHAIYSILNSVETISTLITGKLGYSFLHYLINDADKKLKSFVEQYEHWHKQYEPITPPNLAWACRDTNKLIQTWDQAQAAIEVIENFFETNTGLLSSEVVPHFFLLKLFPFFSSPEYKIYRNIRSLEATKMMIAGDDGISIEDVKDLQGWFQKNLGLLYLDLKKTQGQRKEMEWISETYNCSQYF
jgi:hypothetical protein